MKALAWHGKGDIRCESVPDPKMQHPKDAIIKVTACAICGSDLHIFDGVIPRMKHGDVIGHETMGEVVEVGPEARGKLKVGDRVVVPFTISCGECFFCRRGQFSGCERTNPDRTTAETLWGNSPAGLFGYSHILGGYPGGQAEYLRVPYADVGPLKVPASLTDEQVLFLSDIFPTGYMGAEFCNITQEDTIAIWGCGPVGQMSIRSAFILGDRHAIGLLDQRLWRQRGARRVAGPTQHDRQDLHHHVGKPSAAFLKYDVACRQHPGLVDVV
jgi:threonine dehydrogenase-like Zn-dependent dehydrogenase